MSDDVSSPATVFFFGAILLPGLPTMLVLAMQARGAAVLVVVGAALVVLAEAQAGAELVVVVGAALVVVRSRRMNV